MACCISTWNTCLCISIWALPVLWVPLKHKHGAMNSRRVENTRPGRMRVKTCLFSKRHTLHRICPKCRSYLLNWLWPLLSSSSFSLCSSFPDLSRSVFLHKICMKEDLQLDSVCLLSALMNDLRKIIKTKAGDCFLHASQMRGRENQFACLWISHL